MSGGSWDYLSFKLDDAARRLACSGPGPQQSLRRALGKDLERIARVMHAVEWADSCDIGQDEAEAALRSEVSPQAEGVAAAAALEEQIKIAQATLEGLRRIL